MFVTASRALFSFFSPTGAAAAKHLLGQFPIIIRVHMHLMCSVFGARWHHADVYGGAIARLRGFAVRLREAEFKIERRIRGRIQPLIKFVDSRWFGSVS